MWCHSFLPWESLENHLHLMLIIIIKKPPLSGYKSCPLSQKCRSSECWGWQVLWSHVSVDSAKNVLSVMTVQLLYVIPSHNEQDQLERRVGGLQVIVTVHWRIWGLGKWGPWMLKSVQKALERIKTHLQDRLCCNPLIRVYTPSESLDKKQLVRCHWHSVCDPRVLEYTFDSSMIT